ncbi:MAG: hypothetical protein K2K89_08725 [Ruminococcus sp.]|nr:hypothetical protein [Ruminococcus sp.]
MTSTFTVRDLESLKTLMQLSREPVEYEVSNTYTDYSSVGTHAIYNPSHNSLIIYDNNKTVTEYLPETREVLSTYQVNDYVYSLFRMGDYIIAVEKSEDGVYSMELIEWKDPENYEIVCEKTQMNVSETQRLSIRETSLVASNFRWSTSDKNIVSVTDTGVLTAWGEREAVISCSSVTGKVLCEIKLLFFRKKFQTAKLRIIFQTTTIQFITVLPVRSLRNWKTEIFSVLNMSTTAL